MVAAGHALAQSVKIVPANPYVALGKTIQFSARTTGLGSSDVIWSAAGRVGGTPVAGTITADGLYTAPQTMPGQSPVQIVATSAADPRVSAVTYVNLLTVGPVLASVAPDPLPVGSITITVQGSGFKPGAAVFESYPNGTDIRLSTVSVTETTIVSTQYQVPSGTATFRVYNPGSDASNQITVPVSDPGAKNTLTVLSGKGGGSYAPGAMVSIAANDPPPGQTFLKWTGAAVEDGSSPTTRLKMPAANALVAAQYATVKKYPLTVVSGGGSGSYAPGTVIAITADAPPAGQVFAKWTGAPVQDPTAPITSITMPTGAVTVTATYGAAAGSIPFPVTTHPRLWVTQADLPRLQSWATASNPVYQNGMLPLLNQVVSDYNTQFFPNGAPNPNYPDPGDTQGYGAYVTEQHAIVLAFNSLIDPNPTARIRYAQYARNLLMYAMNQAALGHLAGAPFRDPQFAIYNRANGSGEQWPLIVDWIYNAVDATGQPILTAADKATIRKVFMIWANDCVNAETTGGDHPSPIGMTNSAQLLPNGRAYRMASNNYYLSHARQLTMMALSIDPADDPSTNANAPASQLGNTLRSYIGNANGAWLFQEFAMLGEPATVAKAYGIAGGGAGLGLASGGLPPEGTLYGHSYAYVMGQLLALQTAGFNNPAYSGPQIGLIGAPVWDRFVTGFLTSMAPAPMTDPNKKWMGPVYQLAGYGDLLRTWATPDFMQPFALLALLDQQNGKANHVDAARWFAVNGVEGGAQGLTARIKTPWAYGSSSSILYFMLLDPTAAAAPDPRPTFANTFVDQPAGRIVAHSDWGSNSTMFGFRASWNSINHQLGDGGMFEFFRNGEWLTKELSNYDNNTLGLTSFYHNTLALQNWSANGLPALNWFETGEWVNGSQWVLGQNAGDPVTVSSSGQDYVYAASDLTKLYNHPQIWVPSAGATDVTHASRSVLWINKDYIVVYDRATTGHDGLFKRFHLSLGANPAISGNLVTETLPSGQQLFLQTLLPASPSITSAYAAGNLNPVAQLEPMKYILTVEDPAKPADVRFLHVLQGADVGTTVVRAAYVKSTAGTAFDGAVFGSTAAFFPVNAGTAFAGTTLSVDGSVHTVLVTGLTPGATYGVSVVPGSGGRTAIKVTSAKSGLTADAAGLLKVTF